MHGTICKLKSFCWFEILFFRNSLTFFLLKFGVLQEASSTATKDSPADWPASTTTKCDVNKLWSIGLIPNEEGNAILQGSASRPNPPASFSVMFIAFLYRRLSLPAHEFLRRLLISYRIQALATNPKFHSPSRNLYHPL
jgi:hypothetical protein